VADAAPVADGHRGRYAPHIDPAFAGVLVTRDTSPLEPGRAELRYYAEGVGLVLITTARGDRTELVEMTRAVRRSS
jgi:hypothetical protein